MECRLCLQEKTLLKRSHIIPDFMYQEIYDEKHRIIKFDATKIHKEFMQSGAYQGDILCQNCDNVVLQKFEDYAARFLYNGKGIHQIQSTHFKLDDGLEYLQVENVDYGKFKLFLLSVLWRASISSLPFFDSVKLGPYEEKIRIMLLSGNPGLPESYPCIISTWRKNNLPNELIRKPAKHCMDDLIMYDFPISGFMYLFRVTEKERKDWALEATVNPDGRLKVMYMTEESARKYLNKGFGRTVF